MAGVYVHVPYCKQACSYCDFYFTVNRRTEDSFLTVLAREVELRRDFFGAAAPVTSVYFGGGTPSLLPTAAISAILSQVQAVWGLAEQAEVTLEANPDDLTPGRLQEWRAAGINRISLGLQSLYDDELLFMNRAHTAAEALTAWEWLHNAGFPSYSLDFIYATPGLGTARWEETLQGVLAVRPPHISAYALTIEPGTQLGKAFTAKRLQPVSEEDFTVQFALLSQTLCAGGYAQYEISNLALPGHQARHNSAYWRGEPYVGLGPAAHSYSGTQRFRNVASVRAYITHLQAGTLPVVETETLTARDHFNERVMTGLRLQAGVFVPELQAFGLASPDWWAEVSALQAAGLLVQVGEHLHVSTAGRPLTDYVTERLFLST